MIMARQMRRWLGWALCVCVLVLVVAAIVWLGLHVVAASPLP